MKTNKSIAAVLAIVASSTGQAYAGLSTANGSELDGMRVPVVEGHVQHQNQSEQKEDEANSQDHSSRNQGRILSNGTALDGILVPAGKN